MNSRFRALLVVSAVLSLVGCDKSTPAGVADVAPAVAPVTAETDNQLAEARDALQRQAMEIETKSALMDKQLADMEQALKDRENAELRGSLDALKRQNEALRVQADAARRQSDAITQRIAIAPLPNVAPPPVVQPDYSLFYDGLAPYGRWFDVNGYGYCWRPTITVAGWRPYVDGCWVWSSLGWAWQSNEVFGWATYHYGRWVNLSRYGWVWVPGSEWAPAWVAWRQSRDCVGWAPLPPEQGICNGVYRDCDSRYGLGPTSYTFINTNQFVSSSYISVYAPVTQQTTIFQHSVNVTQIVPRSGHGHGHNFVNQGGPPRGQMEQACGRPVPQRQVETMHADQVPAQQQEHHQRGGHREAAAAPVAMVELPAVTPGTRVRHPDIQEHIQRPTLMGGFDGVPQRVATEIRETIAKEKETAAVQQQPPVHGRMPHGSPQRPGGAAAVVNAPPVLNTPTQETVRPAVAVETPGAAAQPSTGVAVEQTRPFQPEGATSPTRGMPQEQGGERHRTHDGRPSVTPAMPAVVESKAAEPVAGTTAVVVEPERTVPAVVAVPPPAMPPTSVEQTSADAGGENARRHAGETPTQGTAMPHRPRRDSEEGAMAEKRAAEQAATAAEAEKARMQSNAAQQVEAAAQQQRKAAEQTGAEVEKGRQQVEAAAQQQRMAAEQRAAEIEKARQQAEATAQQQRTAAEQAAAMQQQQDLAVQQQRAAAERMANEQAAAETARAQQAQAEAAAMQRQQDEARRAAEEQQMRVQQEAAQRAAQEMAQRQAAEEQARRQQEAEMQRAQEQARQEQMRAQQEAAQRAAQEMAQRQAEEQARRQQEAEMQRVQEQARQEQMRAQQEAAQRAAQEMAQRQAEEQARRAAEEQARRAQEEAQRAAAEAAQRAAAGAGAGGR